MQSEDGSMSSIDREVFEKEIRKFEKEREKTAAKRPDTKIRASNNLASDVIAIPQPGDVLEALKPKVVQTGDVFRIRGCMFEVTDIAPDGILARGITLAEYEEKRKAMPGI
jgi:hypothetical protein